MSRTIPTSNRVAQATPLQSLKAALKQAPSEAEAFIFEIVSFLGALIMRLPGVGDALRVLGRALARILEAISPAMPIKISENASFSEDPWGFYGAILRYVFPITVFFCFLMNTIMTYLSGTLWGPSGTRLYYGQDWYNMILYLVVCPSYVSAAVCLVATTAISWSKFNSYSNDAEGRAGGYHLANSTRFSAFVVIAFLLSSIYIAEYLSDLANPNLTKDLYWFFDRAASGERMLNKAGAYYLFMNAVLLLITAMAALCYIAMSIEMFRLGRSIESSLFAITETELAQRGETAVREREQRLKRELSDFSFCYIWAKVLVLVYSVNIWIWQLSPAGGVRNVHSAIIALLIVGMFFLVVPRLYLASKWYRLKHTYAQRWNELVTQAAGRNDDEGPEYQDLTSRTIRKFVILLDLGFLAFLTLIIGYQYGFGSILDIVLEIQRKYWPR